MACSSISFTAALWAEGTVPTGQPDKALLEWQGQPLWKHQLSLLESLKPEEILIVGKLDGPYRDSGHRIVLNAESDRGPLANLAVLLEACRTEYLLVLAVNMPWMTREVLEKLLTFEAGVVPEHEGWWESTAAVYPVDILPQVRNVLQSPNRSFQSMIELALNCGFIDTWTIDPKYRPCFRVWNSTDPA